MEPDREETRALERASFGILGAKATRPEIDKLLADMPDKELAYLAVEATSIVTHRLARRQGQGFHFKQAAEGSSHLMMPFVGLAAS